MNIQFVWFPKKNGKVVSKYDYNGQRPDKTLFLYMQNIYRFPKKYNIIN